MAKRKGREHETIFIILYKRLMKRKLPVILKPWGRLDGGSDSIYNIDVRIINLLYTSLYSTISVYNTDFNGICKAVQLCL